MWSRIASYVPAAVLIVSVLLASFLVWRLETTTSKLDGMKRDLAELEERYENAEKSAVAAGGSAAAEARRVERLHGNLAKIAAAPNGVGCTDSVHLAIDILRDPAESDGSGSR